MQFIRCRNSNPVKEYWAFWVVFSLTINRIYDSPACASLDVFELIISRLQRAVRSTPGEALISTVKYDFACRLSGYFTEPNWKSRFWNCPLFVSGRSDRDIGKGSVRGLIQGLLHQMHLPFMRQIDEQLFQHTVRATAAYVIHKLGFWWCLLNILNVLA